MHRVVHAEVVRTLFLHVRIVYQDARILQACKMLQVLLQIELPLVAHLIFGAVRYLRFLDALS